MNPEKILDVAKENTEYMRRIRRDIHRCPGVGFENSEAIEYIERELSRLCISSERLGRCGLVASIGCGKNGRSFLLRADTDGLPTKEETGLPFRSENGAFHGCGHDMHAAMLLGATKILKSCEDEIGGVVHFMFQSAEEILEGAKDMLDCGLLEKTKPCGAMMIHVMTGVPIKCGTVIVPPSGVGAPAADFFEIAVRGKGCHGSTPSQGADPIYSAASIVTALSEISSRELAISEGAALTIGCINAGKAANVIPDTAVMKGSLRCFGEDVRKKIKLRLCEISGSVAKVFRTSANVEFTSGCPALINDEDLCKRVLGYTKELFGEKNVLSAKDFAKGTSTTAGSEDFAYISREVPSVMLALAAGEPECGYSFPLHHPRVDFDEGALPYGCAALVCTALREVL